jgi:hypothetical protein
MTTGVLTMYKHTKCIYYDTYNNTLFPFPPTVLGEAEPVLREELKQHELV